MVYSLLQKTQKCGLSTDNLPHELVELKDNICSYCGSVISVLGEECLNQFKELNYE